MQLETVPFNVQGVVDDCVRGQMAKAQEKGVAVKFECKRGAAWTLAGDPLRLRQITANLLSNAIKFTDGGGWVRVFQDGEEMADGRRLVTLEIRDSGAGIAADKLPLIFDKFTQADNSISRKYGGTGLGLAITRRLVELHGGSIRVESELGVGSRFIVELPFAVVAVPEPVPAALSQPVAQVASNSSEEATRILLVEDNVVNQRVVLAMLRKRNFVIDVASNGLEGLEKMNAAAKPYHLILMDVQMPVLDGLETTRRIRAEQRWQHLPIIAMTAHAMTGDRERCLSAGMDAYLSKPVQAAQLIETIEKYLVDGHHVTPPVVTTARPEPALERMLADRLMHGDQALMRTMLTLFVQLAPERLRKLDDAVGKGDVSTLLSEAKMIRAAAQQIASEKLIECARRIEESAANGDLALLREHLAQLRREFEALAAQNRSDQNSEANSNQLQSEDLQTA
jgi:CheY-like chemotaxis protein